MLINLALPGDQLCQYPFQIYLNCWCCSPDYLWLRHLSLLVLNWNNKVKNCICNVKHICNWNIIIIIIIHCLPLHPKHKINIVVRYVYSKLRLEGLKEQNTIMKQLKVLCTGKVLTQWNEFAEQMTTNTYKFARKALIFSLPINTNLKCWNKIINDKCLLCNGRQTQLHVLNNCVIAVNDGRYTWRHDSILYTIVYYVKQLIEKSY